MSTNTTAGVSKLITQVYNPGQSTLQKFSVNYTGLGTAFATVNARELSGVSEIQLLNATTNGALTGTISLDTAPNMFNYNILDPNFNSIGDIISFQLTNVSGQSIQPVVPAPTGVSYTGTLGWGNGVTIVGTSGVSNILNGTTHLVTLLKTATGPITCIARGVQIV